MTLGKSKKLFILLTLVVIYWGYQDNFKLLSSKTSQPQKSTKHLRALKYKNKYKNKRMLQKNI